MKKKFIPQNQDKFIWTIEFPAQDVVHGYQTKNIEYSNFGQLNWKKNVDNFCQGPKLGSKFVAKHTCIWKQQSPWQNPCVQNHLESAMAHMTILAK